MPELKSIRISKRGNRAALNLLCTSCTCYFHCGSKSLTNFLKTSFKHLMNAFHSERCIHTAYLFTRKPLPRVIKCYTKDFYIGIDTKLYRCFTESTVTCVICVSAGQTLCYGCFSIQLYWSPFARLDSTSPAFRGLPEAHRSLPLMDNVIHSH